MKQILIEKSAPSLNHLLEVLKRYFESIHRDIKDAELKSGHGLDIGSIGRSINKIFENIDGINQKLDEIDCKTKGIRPDKYIIN